jgi:hypothetical protein
MAFSLLALAQPIPEGIIVQPAQTPLAVQLGLERTSYSPGDTLRVTVSLNQASYVYIYTITPDRRVNLLFPNAYQPDNLLQAGTHTIPNRRYSFVISPPTGVECLQVLALAAPLSLEQLIGEFSPHNPFPLLSQKPQEFKALMQGLIVGAVSTTGWAAAWTCFQIAPPQARLRVVSTPSGALVSLNGVVMGQTPLEVSLAPGRYRVTLSRFGYEEWSRTLDLKRGADVTLEAQLLFSPFFRPLGRTARLRIVSDPDDADVFINSAYAGRTPVSLEVAPGRYRVVVTKAGYESWSQTLELKGDSDITLEATLKLSLPTSPPPVVPPAPPMTPPALSEPTVVFGLNGGLSEARIPSVGVDFGLAISARASFVGLGVSFLMTGEDVPDYENIGNPIDIGPVMTYREGPETEFYGKLSLALLGGLGVDVAGGLAIQKEAHIALPLLPSGMRALDVVVKPNGYQTEKVYLTGLIGLSVRAANMLISVGMHSRRGWVIGVGVVF